MENKTQDLPLISIIITYYKKNYLDTIFEEIKCNTVYPNYEIIVVENNSPESQEEWIKKNYPYVRYFKLPVNLGFGRANNIGIKKAKGKYCVLLNTDTFPRPNWMNYSIKILEKRPDIGLLSPLCIKLNTSELFITETNHIKYCENPRVSGACLFFNKKSILEHSPEFFDPYFYFYGEDIDINLRVSLMGYKKVVNCSSLVFHGLGEDIKSHKRKSNPTILNRYETHFALYLITKHGTIFHIFRYLFLKLIVSFLFPIINPNCSQSVGIINGIYDYFKDIGRIIKIRISFQKQYPMAKKNYSNNLKSREYSVNKGLIFVFPNTPLSYWQNLFHGTDSKWRVIIERIFNY